jgi:two-component system, LytTR family, response regulator
MDVLRAEGGSRFALWLLIGASGLVLGYWIVFLATFDGSIWSGFASAVANVAPMALLGLFVDRLTQSSRALRPHLRIAAHLIGLVGFSVCWYVMIALGLAVVGVFQGEAFELGWLSGPALVWQGFQAMLAFALLVSLSVLAQRAETVAPSEVPVDVTARSAPLLVFNADGDLVALDPADITLIEAADNGAVILMGGRRVRARTGLASWRERLDRETFIQVHRSYILNLRRLISAEPAGGGRMVAHLEGGLTVPVSRTGARLLRGRAA